MTDGINVDRVMAQQNPGTPNIQPGFRCASPGLQKTVYEKIGDHSFFTGLFQP